MNPPSDEELTIPLNLEATESGVEATIRKVNDLEDQAQRLQATLKALEKQAIATFNAAVATVQTKGGSSQGHKGAAGAAAMFGGASAFGGAALPNYQALADMLNMGGRPAVEATAPQLKSTLDAILAAKQQLHGVVNEAAQAKHEAEQAGVAPTELPAKQEAIRQQSAAQDRDARRYAQAEFAAKRADQRAEATDAKKQEAARKASDKHDDSEEKKYRQAEHAERKRQLADEERDKKRLASEEEKLLKQQQREAAKYKPFGERIAERVASTRTLAAAGALSTGDAGPLGRTLAYAFLSNIATTPMTGLRNTATGILSAFSSKGEEGAAAGAEGGAGAAAAEGAAAPSLAGLAGALLSGPLGVTIAAIAAGVAGGLAVQSARAQVRQQQVVMLGDQAGLETTAPSTAFQRINDQGERFLYSPDEAQQTANTLGVAGVQGGAVPAVMADVMAFARRTGLDLPSATDLGGQIATRNNVNGSVDGVTDQVSAIFQMIEQAARDTQIPVKRFVDTIKTLAAASGGATLTLGGISGLAQIQQMIGPTGNAGQLIAPSLTATGSQALQVSALLGVSPDKLYAMQQNDPAAIIDKIAGFAKKVTHGQKDQRSIDIAESVLSGSGLLNFAGIDVKHQAKFVQDLITQGPTAAEDAEKKRLAAEQAKLKTGAQYRDSGEGVAKQVMSWVQQVARHAEYMGQRMADAGNNVQILGVNAGTAAAALAKLGGTPAPSNVPGKALGADLGVSQIQGPGPNGQTGGVWHNIAGSPDDVGPRRAYFMPPYTPKTYNYQTDPAYNAANGRANFDYLRDAQGKPISVQVPNTRGGSDTAGPEVLKAYTYASQKYKVPLATLLAIGAKESDFRSWATSADGGKGIAQLTPRTGVIDTLTKTKGSPFYGATYKEHAGGKPGTLDPYNLANATEAQAWLLSHLQQQYGSLPAAVQHYNGSGKAAQAYSAAVMTAAQQTDVNLKALLQGSSASASPQTPAVGKDVYRRTAAPRVVALPMHGSAGMPTALPVAPLHGALALAAESSGATAQPTDVNIHVTVHDEAGRTLAKKTTQTKINVGRAPVGGANKRHGPPPVHLDAHKH